MEVEEKSTKAGFSRENELNRSKWIVGINWIANRLMYI